MAHKEPLRTGPPGTAEVGAPSETRLYEYRPVVDTQTRELDRDTPQVNTKVLLGLKSEGFRHTLELNLKGAGYDVTTVDNTTDYFMHLMEAQHDPKSWVIVTEDDLPHFKESPKKITGRDAVIQAAKVISGWDEMARIYLTDQDKDPEVNSIVNQLMTKPLEPWQVSEAIQELRPPYMNRQ